MRVYTLMAKWANLTFFNFLATLLGFISLLKLNITQHALKAENKLASLTMV